MEYLSNPSKYKVDELLEKKAKLENNLAKIMEKVEQEHNQTEINEHIQDRTTHSLFITKHKYAEIDKMTKDYHETMVKWQRMQFATSRCNVYFNSILCSL